MSMRGCRRSNADRRGARGSGDQRTGRVGRGRLAAVERVRRQPYRRDGVPRVGLAGRLRACARVPRPIYFAARREGTIVGVLPTVLLNSWLFGRALVSLPFLNYGGVLADDDAAARALLDAAMDTARARRLRARRAAALPPALRRPAV